MPLNAFKTWVACVSLPGVLRNACELDKQTPYSADQNMIFMQSSISSKGQYVIFDSVKDIIRSKPNGGDPVD